MSEQHHEVPDTEIGGQETIKVLNLYQAADKIYTRRTEGTAQTFRRLMLWPLLLAYLVFPWIQYDDRQLVWFNLVERKFYVFGMVFWPQDFAMLAWLLIIAAFGLFTVTNLLGRVWCGFTCPQTVWTFIFMRLERWCEGDRNQRIKLDSQSWGANKLLRKGIKHTAWLLVALVTGITFVGYFNPIRQLVPDFFTFNASAAAVFWTLFFTFATYANAGFMREQVCKYMCPYARFQSAMFDSDTMIVSYDYNRGEGRGPRKQGADYRAEGLGDCVDCTLCVQVCPTGIDIRDGLQYECISCGLCIDACNTVMDKMGYERGLVRFTTEHNLQGKRTKILRPRLVGYALVLLAMVLMFTYALAVRVPLGVDIIRDRDFLYRITDDGRIENSYLLKINNMDTDAHMYRIALDSPVALDYQGPETVTVEEGEVLELLISLSMPQSQLDLPTVSLKLAVVAVDGSGIVASEETRFIGPIE